MNLSELMDLALYGGTLTQWALALVAVGVIVLAAMWAKPALTRRLEAIAGRTQTGVDDAFVHALQATRIALVAVIAIEAGSQLLALPAGAQRFVDGAATIALFVQVGLWAAALLDFWLKRTQTRAQASNPAAATSLSAIGFVGRVVLWALMLLLVLDNLGIDVTALIAGLGIGGIAVALAVQNILGDLFASLSIVIDKPFVVGDFIIVDDYLGTIEHVGLKTTRIRSLGGEQIIVSNSDLLNTRIRNYKRMHERRVVFKFGVLYQTTPEQLEKIPPIIKRIVDGQEQLRFDRAHFTSFGESSLDFETVFWVRSADYNLYMDLQQKINLALMREFAALGVEFAYPTRTLFVEGPVRLEGAERGEGREPRGETRPAASPPRASHS